MRWGVRELTVHLGQVVALDGVSLDVPPGQVTGVVGGDGAGKTTLLRVLAGALAASSGEVRRPDGRGIGYLVSSAGSYPDLSVDENIEFAASAYGIPARTARARAVEYLERTGLAGFGGRLAGNLSGGMRRKLGLVRSLLHEPDLVVLDEPTTGIDPVSRADLWGMIARAAAAGAAVVFSTTYLDEAERAARLLALDAGRALVTGTPAEIVAAVPGAITARVSRPAGIDGRRAWRRRGTWRVWQPDGPASGIGEELDECDEGDAAVEADQPVSIDLQDAITVFALRRELDLGADRAAA